MLSTGTELSKLYCKTKQKRQKQIKKRQSKKKKLQQQKEDKTGASQFYSV